VRHIAPAGSALDLAAALHESVPDVPVLLTAAWADEIGVDSLDLRGCASASNFRELASALARCLKLSEFSVGELQS